MATEYAYLKEDKNSVADKPDTYDTHIGVQSMLNEETNNGGNLVTVTKHVVDKYGRPVETAHKNPAFDQREYEIKLEDGTMDRIFANRIAAIIYSQVDDKGL